MSDEELSGVGDEVLGHVQRLTAGLQDRKLLALKVSLEVVPAPAREMTGFYGGITPVVGNKRRLTIEYEV